MTKRPKAVYLGRESRMPTCACLNCGKQLDMAAGIGHRRKPRAGSITICFGCGHLMALDGELKFRPLTNEEILDVAGDEVILKAMKAIVEAKELFLLRQSERRESDAAE